MHIKEFIRCEKKDKIYHVLYHHVVYSINYIGLFFHEIAGRIHQFGSKSFIKKLKTTYKEGLSFEMTGITIDSNNKKLFIHETWKYSQKAITSEIDKLIEEDNIIELCKLHFLGYAVMTQENFYHLLIIWEKLIHNKSLYILIYQDNQNWYDSVGFKTQDAMEQFITDHTEPK